MRISDEKRRRAVTELREASTGAYRHVDSLDVIANAVGVEVAGKFSPEPKVEDVRERSLDRPNVMSVTCPSCGMSNRIAWGSLMATPQKEAASMLASSWNRR